MKKLTSLLLALALMLSLGISAFAETVRFDPSVTVEENLLKNTITVTVSGSGSNDDILAEKQPTLSVPCRFRSAEVEFEGEVIDSELEDGVISFTVKKGGTYTVRSTDTFSPILVFPSFDDDIEFLDVPAGAYYADAVYTLVEDGIIKGVSETRFAPNSELTRQQLWMILARVAGRAPANMIVARAWAVENGISDGSNPTASITRQQLAAMLWRFAGSPAAGGTLGFTDKASIADYAKDAVCWCTQLGILSGYADGSVKPAATATRAHVAVMVQRYMEQVG